MIHLQADIAQHPQLLEKGIIIAPVAISRILKKHGINPAIIDERLQGHLSVKKAGYVLVTNPDKSDAIIRVSFVGHPIPANWRHFKDDLKSMGVHYIHPDDDDQRRVVDITTKTVIVASNQNVK